VILAVGLTVYIQHLFTERSVQGRRKRLDRLYAPKERHENFLVLFLAFFAVAQVFPLLWVASYSLQKSGDLFGPELFKLPSNPVWNNYVRAWTDGKIPNI
jgi:ABC-type glycerol-3-phosphate transport system permease component